jgi:mRNA-degrading endonuclease RelE of RelBE toxin-antitoxin system
MPYQIEFAESVRGQLAALAANERALLLEAIEERLTHEPLVETRNRKLLRPNPVAPWELRVEDLRVFYEVEEVEQSESEQPDVAGVVYVLAVGKKEGNVLWIGGKRVEL